MVGRRAIVFIARAAVRQRLVAANHQAKERNVPKDQSMNDRRHHHPVAHEETRASLGGFP
jgi:hypothetical protein